MIMMIVVGRHRQNWLRRVLNMRHAAALGAGEGDCLECGGDGDWGKFIADNEEMCRALTGSFPYVPGSYPCVDCKGTGKIYVGV